MENYDIYTVLEEETIDSVLKKNNITLEQLREANPNLRTYKGISDDYVFEKQDIVIPKIFKEKNITDEGDIISFSKSARYRCEQTNLTQIDSKIISSSLQKTQYNINFSKEDTVKVNLIDYYFNFNPPFLNDVFTFIKETEFIKNNVILKIGNNGIISDIINKNEQNELWIEFKKSEKINNIFTNKLKENNPEAYNNLIDAGDIQFSKENKNIYEYQATPFYMIFFDKYIKDEKFSVDNKSTKMYKSNLFPTIDIKLNLSTTKIKESEEEIEIRTISEQNIPEEIINLIKKMYEDTYKKNIHYSFSQYKIDYRSRLLIDKKTHLIKEGVLRIREAVIDNVESIFEYKIRKLENE